MKIESIALREIHMRLKSPFETSFGVVQNRRILLVEAVADGVSGWGEVTAGESPAYNAETTDTAWHMISDFIAPVLVGKNLATASEFPKLTNQIRGHEMAKSGVENALWDLEARIKGVPLYKLLGGTTDEIAAGVSLGIRENPESLVKRVGEELQSGYQRIKLKIKPGKDLEFVAAVRKEFPKIRLSVDANSAYTLDDAAHLKKLDEFSLDDGTALELGRYLRAFQASGANPDGDLPGRVHLQHESRPGGDRNESLPDYQHQARARQRPL